MQRIGASREMVFSSNHIASKMSDEWQVGDRIESLGSDDNWAAANIIAITDDNKYNLLFESGQVSEYMLWNDFFVGLLLIQIMLLDR